MWSRDAIFLQNGGSPGGNCRVRLCGNLSEDVTVERGLLLCVDSF